MRPDLQEVFAPRRQQTEGQHLEQQQKVMVEEKVEEKAQRSQTRQDDTHHHDTDDTCELESGKQQMTNSDRHQPVDGKCPHEGSPEQHSAVNQQNGIKVRTCT